MKASGSWLSWLERSLHVRQVPGSNPGEPTVSANKMRCITCSNNSYPLCQKCSKNPYFVEKARRELAKTDKTEIFKSLYSSSYAQIRNKNTGKFWDNKFETPVFYDEEEDPTKDRIRIAASFIPKNKKKLLDIGAGVGLIEEYIEKQGLNLEVEGIDISDQSIKLLKKRFKGKFRKGSIYDTLYEKETFDTVLALEVLEHIPPVKIFDILKKIHRFLKPRGCFIGSIPLNEKLWSMSLNENSHLREYSLDVIKKELELSGFKLVESQEIIAFPKMYNIKSFLAKYVLKERWRPNDSIFKVEKK